MKDANLPVMIVQGDMDEAVPVTNTRLWVDTMKEMQLNYEYVEQPGISHGPVIQTGLKPSNSSSTLIDFAGQIAPNRLTYGG
jgi:dipeptidyl aminopeptidase/acylaminoacyl peptidase